MFKSYRAKFANRVYVRVIMYPLTPHNYQTVILYVIFEDVKSSDGDI